MHPLVVINFKYGGGTGQLEDEIGVTLKHEFYPHPENVNINQRLFLTLLKVICWTASNHLVGTPRKEQQTIKNRVTPSSIHISSRWKSQCIGDN
jgi:hypothetical protein